MPPELPCRGCGERADYTIQCLHCELPPERCTHQPMALCFECLVDRVLRTRVTIAFIEAQGTHPTNRQN